MLTPCDAYSSLHTLSKPGRPHNIRELVLLYTNGYRKARTNHAGCYLLTQHRIDRRMVELMGFEPMTFMSDADWSGSVGLLLPMVGGTGLEPVNLLHVTQALYQLS